MYSLFEELFIAQSLDIQPCDLLSSSKKLRRFLSTLKVDQPDPYFAEQFTRCVVAFAQENTESLRSYFAGDCSLTTLNKAFVQQIFNQQWHMDLTRSAMLQSLGANFESCTDFYVKTVLSSFVPKKNLKMLGFGLGSGFYESALARFLIQSGKVESVEFFGYDPYAGLIPGMQMLSTVDLASETLVLEFDLIIARWSLHHVHAEERWTPFIQALNKLSSKSLAIIIEHGYTTPTLREKGLERLYLLLNTWIDVIANIGIVPDWFTASAPTYGDNFYVDYLRTADVTQFQTTCKHSLVLQTLQSGPIFPWQDIFVFSVVL
ncbi:conserved hypothetical protein [Gammaproteobacteria bacterium]